MSIPIEKGTIVGDGSDIIFNTMGGKKVFQLTAFPLGGTIHYWNDGYIMHLDVSQPNHTDYHVEINLNDLGNKPKIETHEEELKVIEI